MREAVSFDPAADEFPEALVGTAGYRGPAVLLLDASPDRRWAADAAVAIAAAWSDAGERVVLVDLHLEDPILHERVGMENVDGIVDVCLYGASLARGARPVPERGFHLIPVGTPTPDPGAVLWHPRWPKIAAGFREAEAWLLLYVPADAPDLSGLATWVTDAILLGPTRAAGDVPGGVRVRAAVEPPKPLEPPAVPVEASPEAPEPAVAPAEVAVPLAAAEVLAEPAAARKPVAAVPEALPRRRAGVLWALFVLLIVAAALAAAWVFGPQFGLRFPGRALPPQPAAVAQPAEPAPAAPIAAAQQLPFSVHVKAYPSLGAAFEQMNVERQRFRGTRFFVSPEAEQGILYFKVFAGPVGDTAAATRLREQLVAGGAVDPNDIAGATSLIKFNPFSFDLGDFPSEPEATSRAEVLAADSIPAYAVPVRFSDGNQRWRVYGGAFGDSIGAESMRGMLQEAGIEPRLVERVGEETGE